MRRILQWTCVLAVAVHLVGAGLVLAQGKPAGVPPGGGTSGSTLGSTPPPSAPGAPPGSPMDKASKKMEVATPIDINTADVSILKNLKGIGPKKAEAIVAYRQANGPFKSPEDLKKVKGIGDKIFDSIKGQITVGKL